MSVHVHVAYGRWQFVGAKMDLYNESAIQIELLIVDQARKKKTTPGRKHQDGGTMAIIKLEAFLLFPCCFDRDAA